MRAWRFAGTLALASAAPFAHAQSMEDLAARRDLLGQAQQARTAGDHTRALDLAQRAAAIQLTPSVQMFLAQEFVSLSRYADALGAAQGCVRDANADMRLHNREEILASCNAMVTDSTAHVARITVQPPSPAPPGLAIAINAHALNAAFWGVPYVVDAGSVVVTASATSLAEFRRELTVQPGTQTDVSVLFAAAGSPRPASPEPSSPPPEPITSREPPPSPPPPVATDTHERRAPSFAGPAATVIAGVVLVGVGAAFGAWQSALDGTLQMYCTGPGLTCRSDQASNLSNYQTATYVADSGFVAGGVVIAAGVVWFVAQRLGSGRASHNASVRFAPLAGGAFVGIGGEL